MKKLFLFLYENNWLSQLYAELIKAYEFARVNAISLKSYGPFESEFRDAEDRLMSSIKSRLRPAAFFAIRDLRKLYREHGDWPTENARGYFEMMDYLSEIEESIIVVSSGQNSGWEK